MAYEKLNLKTGEVLTAEALAHMEQGIAAAMESGEGITLTTYADLVALRDAGQLKAGTFYRITDYVTTTVQENTQSAGHAFDVIVLALDGSTLSEEAYAAVHEGDTYFTEAGANLSAWRLWYSLDNDTERFAWADAENGKGVIYRLIDEWNNDVPYDFKNIMFVRYELEAPQTSESEPWLTQLSANIQAQFQAGQLAYIWAGVADENRYWENDFGEVYSSPTGNTKAFYTFSNVIDDVVSDKSLNPLCHDNSVAKYQNGEEFLSNNVFFSTDSHSACNYNSFGNGCYSNSFGNNCYSNSFGNGCHSSSFGNDCNYNSFGNDCYYNSFGNGCYYNSFGNDCYYNSFGNNCYSNSFGNNCYSNSFGNGCHSSSFGNDCNYNSFGNDCYYNSFGNKCYYNSFGNDCYYNSFGNNCYSNSFGNGCHSSSFGNDCYYNSFGNNCYYNSFGNGCYSNSFGNNCYYNSFGNKCYYNSFKNTDGEVVAYVKNITFGDGCQNVILQNDETASSSQQIQNIRVANGTAGTIEVERNLPARDWVVGLNEDGEITIKALI